MNDRTAHRQDDCSIARTLAVVGEKWTLLLLREAFWGVRRFGEFQANLGAARNLVADRLNTLVEHGLLRRAAYQEPGARPRQEYRLTDKGRDLFPTLMALIQWGDTYLSDPDGPPVVIRHNDCGEPVRAILSCAAGHEPLSVRDVHAEAGPGARAVPSAVSAGRP